MGESEEQRRGRGDGEGGRRERGNVEGEREEARVREDSPVSSPSSGYNSSGPGGNGEVGGRGGGDMEDSSADGQMVDRGLGKHLGSLEEDRGGFEEQLLIDLSSPGEEGSGNPTTWDGVKLVMPMTNNQEQGKDGDAGGIKGRVGHTQRNESQHQGDISRHTVGNHSIHCCHHISYHGNHRHRCQLSHKCDHGHQIKTCHKICSGGVHNTTGSLNRSLCGNRATSSSESGSRVGPGTSPNRSTGPGSTGPCLSPNRSTQPSPTSACSPSPSRRPGWTEFSDDEDLNFTR